MTTLTAQEQDRIRDHFEQQINITSREEMVSFLMNHFRYHTMSSWNRSTSYAHNIKVHGNIGLPEDIKDSVYDMIFCQEWADHMSNFLDQFGYNSDDQWQIGTNGRSSGYLVLYQSKRKDGRVTVCPGRSLDQDEDFYEWDTEDLQTRVGLVCEFDRFVADLIIEFAAFCRTYDVIDSTIMVPKTVQILQEKHCGKRTM